MTYLRAWLGTVVSFLIIDLAWITLVVRDLYEAELGSMMRETLNVPASAAFYLAYTVGIVYLAVEPALRARSMAPALLRGAAFGALAYGTYTVTNYAIFEAWTMTLLVSDILWGAFLTATCAACGYLASR
ncbi:MAG: DUF2177 family protein [Woeseia sp.]|nr:DUF2177 family protein [Woeseia sp.]MBT8095718.1 DUF2177 family protein [Woeseia sp.]NNE61351.1 DUF2177 family protein [Woeseia sp.]NNL55902.1 DUF2177 family protein [Woeseia sp.]